MGPSHSLGHRFGASASVPHGICSCAQLCSIDLTAQLPDPRADARAHAQLVEQAASPGGLQVIRRGRRRPARALPQRLARRHARAARAQQGRRAAHRRAGPDLQGASLCLGPPDRSRSSPTTRSSTRRRTTTSPRRRSRSCTRTAGRTTPCRPTTSSRSCSCPADRPARPVQSCIVCPFDCTATMQLSTAFRAQPSW